MRASIILPTADPDAFPAKLSIRLARRTGYEVVPVVSSGPSFSFSRSINQGIMEAGRQELYILLNDDCFMDDGWLDAIISFVNRHPSAGVVGAVLRYPHKRGLQHAGGWIALIPPEFILASARTAPFRALRQVIRRRRWLFPWSFNHYRRVGMNRLDFVTGACLAVTKDCLNLLRDFDESYPMGMEDVDLCLRALRQGFEVGLAMNATGIHYEGFSSQHMQEKKEASVRLFQERWDAQEIWRLTRGIPGKVTHRMGITA